jgi:hypothetical protein
MEGTRKLIAQIPRFSKDASKVAILSSRFLEI